MRDDLEEGVTGSAGRLLSAALSMSTQSKSNHKEERANVNMLLQM